VFARAGKIARLENALTVADRTRIKNVWTKIFIGIIHAVNRRAWRKYAAAISLLQSIDAMATKSSGKY